MYSFDLQNVVPSGDLTCLFAKASIDESNLWNMRLGYVNFKTLNKLVKGNLVRGLPSKNLTLTILVLLVKRESSTKLPQNRVAERKNMILIKAARTMLADSLLPNTFWAEAIKTACYVLNRALVTKTQNKTPYELLNGRTPRLDFMRPFGCPVTILNTLDPLRKFEGKADEGFLVEYSVTSKAFRVFNTKTRKVKENLHVRFLENKLNVAGTGPNWLFDIDSLTNAMNYIPVSTGNQTDKNAGPQATNGNADDKPTDDKPKDDNGSKTVEEPINKEDQAYRDELDRLMKIETLSFSSSRLIPKLRFDFPYSASLGHDPGSLGDKIICDLDKTPNLSPRPPQNCPKILQDSFESSNDNTNVVNALQEPFVVNQDPEDIFCHQCTCELCGNGAHYGYNCPSKVSIVPNPEPCHNQTIDELPRTLPSFDPTCYSENGNSFTYDSTSNLVLDSANNRVTIKTLNSRKIFMIFNNNIFVAKIVGFLMKPTNEEEKQIEEEQAAKGRYWKISICYDDDDDDDYTIAITPTELNNSLSMGDEHLDTILATKLDEFIKSSVENLVPNPMMIDSLFDEFADELTLLKSIPSGIKETDCDPEEEICLIKRLLIDLSFTLDDSMPSGIEEDDYDSERDILILQELLSNDSLSLPENKSFHFDIPSSSRPHAKPPDGNLGILNVKVMGDISEQ
nr:hypothetical protein [Tanacetum cinerariifolium]